MQKHARACADMSLHWRPDNMGSRPRSRTRTPASRWKSARRDGSTRHREKGEGRAAVPGLVDRLLGTTLLVLRRFARFLGGGLFFGTGEICDRRWRRDWRDRRRPNLDPLTAIPISGG